MCAVASFLSSVSEGLLVRRSRNPGLRGSLVWVVGPIEAGHTNGAQQIPPLRYPGFPVGLYGVGGLHAPFLKRKAHTWFCLALRGRKSGFAPVGMTKRRGSLRRKGRLLEERAVAELRYFALGCAVRLTASEAAEVRFSRTAGELIFVLTPLSRSLPGDELHILPRSRHIR